MAIVLTLVPHLIPAGLCLIRTRLSASCSMYMDTVWTTLPPVMENIHAHYVVTPLIWCPAAPETKTMSCLYKVVSPCKPHTWGIPCAMPECCTHSQTSFSTLPTVLLSATLTLFHIHSSPIISSLQKSTWHTWMPFWPPK